MDGGRPSLGTVREFLPAGLSQPGKKMPIKEKLSVRSHSTCHVNPTTWGSQARYWLPKSSGKLSFFN